MTRAAAILSGIALLILFAYGQIWLFSLIDRSMDQVDQRLVMRDAKTGSVVYFCNSPKPKKLAKKSLTSKE